MKGPGSAQWFSALPTPQSLAARAGLLLVPIFLALGLLLGVVARAWMRLIAREPEFTWSGTLAIVLGFAFFAAMQSVAAIASATPWQKWRRRVARALGVIGLLPLFVAAGSLMAPAVVLAGLAVWHPRWPLLIRCALALLVVADLAVASLTITADFGMSARSLMGISGLLVIYSCIVWMAGGTFAPPRSKPMRGEASISG